MGTLALFVAFVSLSATGLSAPKIWRIDLAGEWRFSIGDDLRWASPDFDDSDWELLYAPALWDGQGYADYDGFGWYRKRFFVPAELKGRPLLFEHGGVDDDDWVYINGVEIGHGKGCYKPRSYIIPPKIVRYGGWNLVAVRIYDGAMGGGLARGPLSIREVTLSDHVRVENVNLTYEMGNPRLTLHFEVVSRDGRPHEVGADVSVLDFFLRPRLKRRLKVSVPKGSRARISLPFEAGDSKDYRIRVVLREKGEEAEFFRHIPASITVGLRPAILLSGPDWEILRPPDDKLTFPPEGKWERIEVPHARWGGWGGRNHRVWLRKRFFVPKSMAGRRLVLRFEAVAHHAVVYVNRKKAGEHLGGFEPFEFDVTDFVKIGSENELLVGATDWVVGLREGVPVPEDPEKMPPRSMLIPYGTRPQARRGIWDDVWLYARAPVHIEDVFVKPSVRKKTLTLDIWLRNDTGRPVSAVVGNEVYDGWERALSLPRRVVSIPPRGSVKLTVSKKWPTPHLWWPFDPHLYRLRTTLLVGGREVDEVQTRFGFREVWIDGTNYRLNGRIFKLFGLGCAPIARGLSREEIRRWFEERLQANFTLVRFHTMPRPEFFYEVADEVGMCVKDESAFYCAARVYALDDERFWRNMERHIRGMVLRARNHPSLLIWSAENEILHCGGWAVKGAAERIASLGRLIKSLDPTRPVEFEGDGDLLGRAETANLHYPREFGCHDHNLWPNDAYWLSRGERNDRWPQDFVWKRDKPLIIGEFCHYPYSRPPGGVSIFLGDEVYASRETERRAHLLGVKFLCDALRRQGVAGLNPWVDDLRYSRTCLKHIAVTFEKYDKTFFEGDLVERKVGVHNDTLFPKRLKVVVAALLPGFKPIRRVERVCAMEPGTMRLIPFSWRMPPVGARTKVLLVVKVYEGGKLACYEERTLWAFPRRKLTAPGGLRVALFDPEGKVEGALRSLGLRFAALRRLDELDGGKFDLLLVGPGAAGTDEFERCAAKVRRVAERGGLVFLFEQRRLPMGWLPVPLTVDERRAATMAYIGYKGHPLLKGLKLDDLKFWRGDHLVCNSSFPKPSKGPVRILVEVGGRGGLRWTPLLEIPLGEGSVVLCQLLVGEKLAVEPVAQLLLQNLLNYAASRRPTALGKVGLLSEPGSPLATALDSVGAEFDLLDERADFDGYRIVVVDGRFLPKLRGRLPDLRKFAERGGIVWVHRPSDPEALRQIVPSLSGVRNQKVAHAAKSRTADPLLSGLSNSDLFWYREDCRFGDWEGRGTGLIGPVAEAVLKFEGKGAVRLTVPCVLAKAPVGEGFVLLDTMRLEDAPAEAAPKAMRILSILLTNMGARFQTEIGPRKLSFSPISLKQYFNAALKDEVAGDGKGGWTDQGENDMRELPRGRLVLCGVPFLIEGGCIAMRSPEHLPAGLERVRIPLNVKCRYLFFLHAGAWCSESGIKLATIKVVYDDGEAVEIPVISGFNIGDWWTPRDLVMAKVAWLGKNPVHEPVGLYLFRWRNFRPDVAIEALDIESANSEGAYLLVALTAGD